MENMAKAYFAAVADIRSGNDAGVEKMMSLWADDGVLEVSGGTGEDGWPRRKVYKGSRAIRARFAAMMKPDKVHIIDIDRDVASSVKVVVGEINVDKASRTATAAVTAALSTDEDTPRSFGIEAKNFVFSFDNEKIQHVSEDVSWSDAVVTFNLMGPGSLSVQDIGRLTLAAWAIA